MDELASARAGVGRVTNINIFGGSEENYILAVNILRGQTGNYRVVHHYGPGAILIVTGLDNINLKGMIFSSYFFSRNI